MKTNFPSAWKNVSYFTVAQIIQVSVIISTSNQNRTFAVHLISAYSALTLLLTKNTFVRSRVYKAAKKVGMVSKVFSTRSPAFLQRVSNSYIRPILDYVSPAWSSSSIAFPSALKNVLRRYMRKMDGLSSLA